LVNDDYYLNRLRNKYFYHCSDGVVLNYQECKKGRNKNKKEKIKQNLHYQNVFYSEHLIYKPRVRRKQHHQSKDTKMDKVVKAVKQLL